MTRTTRTLALASLIIVLIAILLVLAPNLQRIELQPGTQDLSFLGEVDTTNPDFGTESPGAGFVGILLRVSMIAAVVAGGGILVAAIFHRKLRFYVIAFLILCGMVFGIWYFLMWNLQRTATPAEVESQAMPDAPRLVDLPEEPPVEEEAPPPPGWSFATIAAALAVGVAALLIVLWVKLAPRWKNRGADEGKTELEELIDTVGSAADEIQLGGDPRAAVLRCYREMIRIFSRRKTIDHRHLTAREFAEALHRAGFTARHVDQLTSIFELVRYGNRGGRLLAERAIDCLEAIREAYASS